MPEKIGGGRKRAIHGMDLGIRVGMTAWWVLPWVFVIAVGIERSIFF